MGKKKISKAKNGVIKEVEIPLYDVEAELSGVIENLWLKILIIIEYIL